MKKEEKILKKLRIDSIKYVKARCHYKMQCGLCKCVHKLRWITTINPKIKKRLAKIVEYFHNCVHYPSQDNHDA